MTPTLPTPPTREDERRIRLERTRAAKAALYAASPQYSRQYA